MAERKAKMAKREEKYGRWGREVDIPSSADADIFGRLSAQNLPDTMRCFAKRQQWLRVFMRFERS